MQKDKLIYRQMKRYRCKYLAINIILTVLVVLFVVAKLPYIGTSFRGESALDVERFVRETKTVEINEEIVLGRKDTKTPDGACFRSNSYWQDNIYLYTVDAQSIENTGEGFTQEITNGTTKETVQLYKVYLADIGGTSVAVLANAYAPVDTTLTGSLTELPKCVKAAVSRAAVDGLPVEISEYMLDVRGVEMDTERTDFVLLWIFAAVLIWLWAKLVRQHINPLTTPTYRQLIKYGEVTDVESDINRQAESDSAYTDKKYLVLEDYILEKDTFKYKVSRNHRAKH